MEKVFKNALKCNIQANFWSYGSFEDTIYFILLIYQQTILTYFSTWILYFLHLFV
jgi:hypothetical protein